MYTPAEAKAMLDKKHQDDKARAQHQAEKARAAYTRLFEEDGEFCKDLEVLIDDGIRRAIARGGQPFYILTSNDLVEAASADGADFAKLSWLDEGRTRRETGCVSTIGVYAAPCSPEGKGHAGLMSRAVEKYLQSLGWKTERLDKDLRGNVKSYRFCYLDELPPDGPYSAFRLCYEG